MRILRLARTSRWAIVASGTRKARATSAAVSPPTAWSVSATCASTASAGWQQVKISASRSSGRVSTSSSSAASARASSSAFRSSVRARRIRSIAAFRATVWIQAPGRRGIPLRGQRLERLCERVLHRVLGELEVAEDTDQGREDAAPLVPEDALELVYPATSAVRSTTGRTSIEPFRADGIRAAHWMASSIVSASIR